LICRASTVMKVYDLRGKRVWITGHGGMVGGALVHRLQREECETITVDHNRLDLRCQQATEAWMEIHRPDVIVVAAARVGGIRANSTYPADFLFDNLAIASNIIRVAWEIGVEKLLFLGSSCIYPRGAAQPIAESALLTGPLEPTNEWYAVAKIAGIKLCQAFRRQYGCDFISAMPTNLYGPGDNFHPENGHVPAALLRRFHDAKIAGRPEVTVWGTGQPRREFLFVDDMADACVFLLKHYSGESPVNVGTGTDLTIREFAEMIKRTVNYEGRIVYDTSRPDGMARKLLDVSILTNMGWKSRTSLEDGLTRYYEWFLESSSVARH
jgi:GDP-L-fucose synthase